jgi:hypothetical protein
MDRRNNINISGGNVGVVNTGTIHHAQVAINSIADNDFKTAIQNLEKAVEDDAALEAPVKTEAIEVITTLAEQAAKPTAERRTGMIKTLTTRLGELTALGKAASDAWGIAGPMIREFFGLP